SGANRVHLLPNQTGAVLGVVFRQEGELLENAYSQCHGFSGSEADQIISEGPPRLVRWYWGSYVAVLARPFRQCLSIFRGPMSDLPCYHVAAAGMNVFCSRAED